MKMIPNPASVRLVADLRHLLDLLREFPIERRDNRCLSMKCSTSKQTMQNRLDILMAGGIVKRGVAIVRDNRESFVYSICGCDVEIERHLHSVLMEHAKPAGAQRQKTYLSRLKNKARVADPSERARLTAKIKEQLRNQVCSYSDLPREFFGPAVHA